MGHPDTPKCLMAKLGDFLSLSAICDRLLWVGTAQGKPGRDGWFAGSYIKGVLVKFGVIIYGLGISVGTHAVLDSA